jgi:hypothetical protein
LTRLLLPLGDRPASEPLSGFALENGGGICMDWPFMWKMLGIVWGLPKLESAGEGYEGGC